MERVPERSRALEGDVNASNAWVTRWSRDGHWLYFASDRSGLRKLWKMRADGPKIAVRDFASDETTVAASIPNIAASSVQQ